MHHLTYPQKDCFISNRTNLDDKNFGIDELLQVGTQNIPQRVLNHTTNYYYTDATFSNQGFTSFTGIFTGSLAGTVITARGHISGAFLLFSSSYFSGSIDNNIITEISGSVSGSWIDGDITGSIIAPYLIGNFIGQITGSHACLTGTGNGYDTVNRQQWTTTNIQFIDRALLKFDLEAISSSISNGSIVNPKFALKVKVCNEYDLPITYAIYALPISQSWNMGDGYLSDGGSDYGVSWQYRDNNNGTSWYNTVSGSRPTIDYITNPSAAITSFGFGGGTWYTSSICSQSFQYESSDINIDVTSIVNSWLSGSIPNEGFMLVSSDELMPTGSGFTLKFFSRDTNTIYSPYLDVMWDDVSLSGGYITGSESTGSITISTVSAGISGSSWSGSTLIIAGGVSGSFSGSAAIITRTNYITAIDQIFNYYAPNSIMENNVWYANNGYHYDTWQSAWDLDPHHGGFLPGTDIQAITAPDYGSPPVYQFSGSFTGSLLGTGNVYGMFTGSGQFSARYFLGLLDGASVETSGSVSASNIQGLITGSVTMQTMLGNFTGTLTSPSIYLNGTGSGTFLDSTFLAFNGFTDGMGLTGNIQGMRVFGPIDGLTTISQSLVTGPCGKSFSSSLAKATFTGGIFSGSTFTAYYVDHRFENALLTGSWTQAALLGIGVNIPLPSAITPYAYAYITGPYVNGTAIGLYVISGSTSASFNGQFTDGNFIGGVISVQLTGSAYTSSFSYTSSVEFTSSTLSPLDIGRSFSISLQNLLPVYKAGDIIKIGVFGRKQFPLKYFGKSTQQEQYMTPEYLPVLSYYALKDNETDEIVMDFDEYTKIGCEYPDGNYFLIDTTGLPQDRYYRILIRVEDGSTIYTVDCGKTFKLTR